MTFENHTSLALLIHPTWKCTLHGDTVFRGSGTPLWLCDSIIEPIMLPQKKPVNDGYPQLVIKYYGSWL